jgi:hypothetical protein
MPEAQEEVVRRVTYFLWRILWKEYIELPTIRPKYMLPSEELDSIFQSSDLEVIAYLLPEARPVDLALFWSSSISLLTLYVKEVSEKEPTWEFCTMTIPTLMNSYLTKIVDPILSISTSRWEYTRTKYQTLTETISSIVSQNIVMLPGTQGSSLLIDLTPIIDMWRNSVLFARLTPAESNPCDHMSAAISEALTFRNSSRTASLISRTLNAQSILACGSSIESSMSTTILLKRLKQLLFELEKSVSE